MPFINAQGNLVEGESDLANALLECPEGGTCTFCGGPNTFADDCGFYYIHPNGKQGGFACESCWDGEPGRKHRERYGAGER